MSDPTDKITKQIQSTEVVRLILQYLKEAGLRRTFHCLQEESGIVLNAVDNVEALCSDILKGKWDVVLDTAGTMELPEESLFALYEHVIHELIDSKEFAAANILLHQTSVMQSFKVVQPEQYKTMESLIANQRTQHSTESKRSLYHEMSRDKRRQILAKTLTENVQQVVPSRLLGLLGFAMRWQYEHGMLTECSEVDIFSSVINSKSDSATAKSPCINHILRTINLSPKNPPQTVTFSPNGKHLITGCADGLIEVWNWMTGYLDTTLEYQKKDFLMAHENAVLALSCSLDSAWLASGCSAGTLKVWDLLSGDALHTFLKAHDKGISSVCFHTSEPSVLTASYDMTAKLFGLKSNTTLQVYRGHAAYLYSALFSADNTRVITGSADGWIKIWDTKTADCLLSFFPPPPAHMSAESPPAINCIILPTKTMKTIPQDSMIVSTKSNVVYIVNFTGTVLKKVSARPTEEDNIVGACVAHNGHWIYAITESYKLQIFSVANGVLHDTKAIHTKDVLGIAHHPTCAALATISIDGTIHIMGP